MQIHSRQPVDSICFLLFGQLCLSFSECNVDNVDQKVKAIGVL